MEIDDLEPRNKPKPKKDLEVLGVEELEEYIAELEAEIARARATIGGKTSHRSAADALFKK
ncbi:MAG: DUF1192 domain-containing protein [Rhodospirillaceae bacterium]|jgi:uncharacterized small protein (DUF1192 family)|nr:DUF1192 domain-containing protein [Rhodospirillaceae bacterium]MBT6117615.1 DUF1192 domain-containing protein [Rhodospirillaceae bacterium]